jgi:hypothetical protein
MPDRDSHDRQVLLRHTEQFTEPARPDPLIRVPGVLDASEAFLLGQRQDPAVTVDERGGAVVPLPVVRARSSGGWLTGGLYLRS